MTSPYTSVSVTGYNSSPPDDDGSQIATNQVRWSNHTSKIGDPLKTAIETLDTNVSAAFDAVYDQSALEAAGLVTPTDYSKLPHVLTRYGNNTTPGTTDMASAFDDAFQAAGDWGSVYVPPGIYGVSTLTFVSKRRIWGPGVIVPLDNTASQVFNLNGLTDIELIGLRFDLTGSDVPNGDLAKIINAGATTDVTLRDLRFWENAVPTRDKNAYCIWSDNSVRIGIGWCRFKDLAVECIRSASSEHANIGRNFFENIQEYNQTVHTDFNNRCIIIGGSSHGNIWGNNFRNIGTTDTGASVGNVQVACIDVGNAEHSTINGNNGQNVYAGIDIETSSSDFHNTTVTGNHFTGFAGAGPVGYEYGRAGVWINLSGQSVENVTVTGNVCEGFRWNFLASNGLYVTITGNVSDAAGEHGIFMDGVGYGTITNNIVTNASQDTTNTYDGIRVKTTTAGGPWDVSHNKVYGSDHQYSITIDNNNATDEGSHATVAHNHADRPMNFDPITRVREYNNFCLVTQSTIPTIADGDTTPDLTGAERWITANTGSTTITDVTMGYGETKIMVINDNNTTVDFTQSALTGNAGVSFSGSNGDVIEWRRHFDGTVHGLISEK